MDKTIDKIWEFTKQEAVDYLSENCEHIPAKYITICATKDGQWFNGIMHSGEDFSFNIKIGGLMDMVETKDFTHTQSYWMEIAWLISHNNMPPCNSRFNKIAKCVCGANNIYGQNNGAHSHWCDVVQA